LRHNDKFEKRGLSVEVRNSDINFALRKFKKKIAEDGILQELRNREFYEKPSEKRAKAKKAGRARWLKKLATMNDGLPLSKSRKY
jgi:small subunit ribosomal protein S21|tara:strand:- start:223 stop:477 length:255 start_codon:yes stop_codon:yes gene_type:complete